MWTLLPCSLNYYFPVFIHLSNTNWFYKRKSKNCVLMAGAAKICNYNVFVAKICKYAVHKRLPTSATLSKGFQIIVTIHFGRITSWSFIPSPSSSSSWISKMPSLSSSRSSTLSLEIMTFFIHFAIQKLSRLTRGHPHLSPWWDPYHRRQSLGVEREKMSDKI